MLHSFIVAYKVLSKVLPTYADRLNPLQQVVAGKKSHEKITWSEPWLEDFHRAQEALHDNKVIHLPRPSDKLCPGHTYDYEPIVVILIVCVTGALWIVTDAFFA